MKIALILGALLVTAARAFEDHSLMCISDPPLELVAGASNISAVHEYPFGDECRALLQFANEAFAPITYAFKPTFPCPGPLVTSFTIPPGAPDGSARVIWQCAGSTTCSFVSILNGTSDALLARQQDGTAGCLTTSPPTDVGRASGWGPQSLTPTIPFEPGVNNGSNYTATSLIPPLTTNSTQVSAATQLTPPSTMSWTMLTVTRTVTSLLTTTLTSI